MSTLTQSLSDIELELHTLETATPRNSATVSRGGLSVVDEGRVIVEAGGTVFFGEGGSAVSGNYSITESTGWQVGTERRGSSIVVLNDIPGAELEVTTADSSVVYEVVPLDSTQPTSLELGTSSSMIVQIFHTSETKGDLVIDGENIYPTSIIKSKKEQWAYSYMSSVHSDVDFVTTLTNVEIRVARLSVNNAS